MVLLLLRDDRKRTIAHLSNAWGRNDKDKPPTFGIENAAFTAWHNLVSRLLCNGNNITTIYLALSTVECNVLSGGTFGGRKRVKKMEETRAGSFEACINSTRQTSPMT